MLYQLGNIIKENLKLFIVVLFGGLIPILSFGQFYQRNTLNKEWYFKLDSTKQYINDNSTTGWRELNLPHDWSIEMPFDKDSPASSGGGYLSGGVGWYKKELSVPKSKKGQRFFIEFEGVYENSEVWLNGHLLGKRPNGYIGFSYDLTDYLHVDPNKKNVLTVKVDNSRQPNSRFYSGSGIYRNVYLVSKSDIHIAYNSLFVKSNTVNDDVAQIQIQCALDNYTNTRQNLKIVTKILSPKGELVKQTTSPISLIGKEKTFVTDLTISKPLLWDINNPQQYTAVVEVINGNKIVDSNTTKFGLRYFDFNQEMGFSLNGRNLKIRGVCLHSDLGSLGMAFNKSAALRQLTMMKEMGVNSIRTSHNPTSPIVLDLCDSLGLMVMSETFDVWKFHKNTYDYHLYWDDWHRQDFIDHVKRDRNHPSLIIWCLGNEAQEQWHSREYGTAIPKELVAIVDSLDGTRPTTIAINEVSKDNPVLMSDAVDIVGYNYNHKKWKDFPQQFPNRKFIVTESTSALESRGYYDLLPVDSSRMWPERWDIPFEGGNQDKKISAYDHVYTPWGSDHHSSLYLMENNDFVSGMYVWTGFDYLGEPTPYLWPARSSYFGIVDLAGFPKDVYYLYQSVWTDKDVLHILPHWNWSSGDKVDVVVYCNNADKVELYLNNKLIDRKSKSNDRYDIIFNQVDFAPGELKAISYKGDKIVKTTKLNTASQPYRVKLSLEKQGIDVGGDELAFVHAYIVDENDNVVPNANSLITFSVTNGASIIATDNGNTTDTSSFQSNERHAFQGKALAIIRLHEKGTVKLEAKSGHLKTDTIEIIGL